MAERWVGIVVSSSQLIVVDVEAPASGPFVIQSDSTWTLQGGDRPAAYAVMHKRIAEYLREHKIDRVILKASALSQGGTQMAHLEAAELRGVAACAAAEVVPQTDTL